MDMNVLTLLVVAVIAVWGSAASEVAASAAATINEAATCVRVGSPSQADYTVEISTVHTQGPSWSYRGQGGNLSVAVDYIRATAVSKRRGAIIGAVEVERPVATVGIWAGPFGLSGIAAVEYGEVGKELGRRLLALLVRQCPQSTEP
jgi:hypothetical protein